MAGRNALLLPELSRSEAALLPLAAPYRLEGGKLEVTLAAVGPGRLDAAFFAFRGGHPGRPLWQGRGLPYAGPSSLALDLAGGVVRLGAQTVGEVPLPLPGRRLSWQLRLAAAAGTQERTTSHYLPVAGRTIGRDYFEGDNYVDHESTSADEGHQIAGWLRRHGAVGPVLEVGCATGGALAALDAAGLPSLGLDLSAWAVERATERLGPGRAWVCNAEEDPFPAAVEARAPYGAIVLWSVLEHFRDPFATLARLGPLTAPGSLLLVQTTNCRSLTSNLFGRDWEGYFDWTHLGVERLSVDSVRRGLPRLGWRIEHLHTHLVWTMSADPTHATLRDWYAGDARFRALLAEHGLGDLILVVARREAGPPGEAA